MGVAGSPLEEKSHGQTQLVVIGARLPSAARDRLWPRRRHLLSERTEIRHALLFTDGSATARQSAAPRRRSLAALKDVNVPAARTRRCAARAATASDAERSEALGWLEPQGELNETVSTGNAVLECVGLLEQRFRCGCGERRLIEWSGQLGQLVVCCGSFAGSGEYR